MRIVKELFRLAAIVWMILLMAVIVNAMTETADACGSADCEYTKTPKPTGTLVPTEEDDDDPTRTPKPTDDDDDDDPTRTPKPTKTPNPTVELTDTPKPSNTPDPTETSEPTATPTELIVIPTERPYDCNIDGDGVCPGEETPPPIVIVFTPISPKPIPTETRMVQTPLLAVACSNTCCSACCGCLEQMGIGPEVIDYSEAILEFKLIAYILTGIFGANTLLRTYGTFRKN